MGGIYQSLGHYGKTRYIWVDKDAALSVDNSFTRYGDKIALCDLGVHENICQALHITKDLPGDYVEIGVYKGGSALTALNYMKRAGIQRKSYLLDTFNGMTYQEAYDSADLHWRGTHVLSGVELTKQHLRTLLQSANQHFELVESNICRDSLPNDIIQIAVCNLDVDLYEATLAGLEKVAPLIVKGGIIVCEDPTSTPALGGALLAMEEFLTTDQGKKFIKVLAGAQYFLIKMEK